MTLLKILGELDLIQLDRHDSTVAHPHYLLRLSTVHGHYLIHLRLFLFQISSL